jgi:alpha-methylacyl-CoA racemase
MSGPLAGLKIIEFVGVGPAPFCSMMLADMGAEVIRIDSKKRGDTPGFAQSKFDVLARGRRSVVLDLKKAEGREAALRMIEQADALIEGFRPGVMERLGLGPEVCEARNPRLVFGRMTGWGQTGPLAKAAGHDINYIAITGLLNAIGRPGQPPPPPLNLVGDFGGGGMFLAFGLVCALLETSRSGRGQVVDAAMVDGAALQTSMIFGMLADKSWRTERGANLLDGAAHFYDTYECADGKFVAIGSVEPQFYRQLCEHINLTVAPDESQYDRSTWPRMKAKVAAIFAQRTRDEWTALLKDADACFAPVLDWTEAPGHAHNQARETYIEIEGVTQPAPGPRFSRTPGGVRRPPAQAGEHGMEILAEWGFSAEEVEKLRAAEAVLQ